MNITADENIPYVSQAFNALGTVTKVNGREITKQHLQQTDILLVRSITQVNKSLLENTPVQFVASATAGFNHIDLNYLSKKGISFARAPGSNAISAAEYVFAGICYWSLKEDKKLCGLTIGIIGCGNVGSRVKLLCESSGMHCVINDPPLEKKQTSNLRFSNIDEALKCDIVTLHTPLSYDGEDPTFRLLNEDRIKRIKQNALVINASRGEVVEEPALLKRINKDKDLNLILDVWENEPAINPEMLKNTLIGTPHIAGYSIDGKIRGTEMIYQATCNFLNIEPQWSAREVDFGNNTKACIELTPNKDQRHEVLTAYNISDDSKTLKELLQDPSLATGKYFDSLRKDYPPRREYSTLT